MRLGSYLSQPGDPRSHAAAIPMFLEAGEPVARWSKLQLYVLGMWVVVLLDPQWWIASFGPSWALRVPPILVAALLPLTMWRHPPKDWFPPMLCFFGYQVVAVPFAQNTGSALELVKVQFLYYALALGTLTVITRARQALALVLLLFLVQYVWWALHGATIGSVRWHPTNGNEDGFGALMVIGLVSCIYCAQASRIRRDRALSLLVAAACAWGVVASKTRGTVVAGAVVIFFAWLRSPRKARTAMAVAVAAGVVMLAANLLFPEGAYWAEIQSAFSEGLEEGTGAERWELWKAATKVFLEHPLIGVGPGSFGPYAATSFAVGEVGGRFADNPGRLWDQQLHSMYFQVLSELGFIGVCLFLWLLVDFWRVNAKLRSPDRILRWAEATGARLDLRVLSLGLEAAMVAFLATSILYVQLYVHWLWTLLLMNRLLLLVTKPPAPPVPTWPRRGGLQ